MVFFLNNYYDCNKYKLSSLLTSNKYGKKMQDFRIGTRFLPYNFHSYRRRNILMI